MNNNYYFSFQIVTSAGCKTLFPIIISQLEGKFKS